MYRTFDFAAAEKIQAVRLISIWVFSEIYLFTAKAQRFSLSTKLTEEKFRKFWVKRRRHCG